MTQVLGPHCLWQTGQINGRPHAIEKVQSQVTPVAYCDSAETAELLVDALKIVHDNFKLYPNESPWVRALLERAGLI
jgi:hypothetical protein